MFETDYARSPQRGDWWCGRCRAFNWRSRRRCLNCGHVRRSWSWILGALAIAAAIAAGGVDLVAQIFGR